jgi:hypothetical protein
VKNFNIFSKEEQEFLQSYDWLWEWPEFVKPTEDNQAQEYAENFLQIFETENNTLRCTGGSALHALFP